MDPRFAAWSLDLGVSLRAAKAVVAGAAAKSMCALGDVNGDGYDDILVRYAPGQTEGHAKFQALAGPDFAKVLWTVEPRDGRLAKCGADVTGDGAADPILVTPPAAPPRGVAVEVRGGQDTMTPVDGATGQALGDVVVEGSGAVARDPTGNVPGEAAAAATSGDLLPSATDTLVAVAASRTGAEAGPAGASRDEVQVQVVDASGEVRGTVALPAGSDSLAVAALPPDTGAVAVLTERGAAAVDQAPAGVPTVTVAGPDGTVLWAQAQEPTTGVPVLLPQAGDVDGDGVGDLVYATVPADVPGALPSSGYAVLSGADGQPILASAQETAGLQTALPFGDADGIGGEEILVVEQANEAAPVELSVVEADGTVQWTVSMPAGSEPANAETDANGNAAGFSDLTGDGVPDAAVAVPSGDGVQVLVVDGATGKPAWTATFPGADSVTQLSQPEGADAQANADGAGDAGSSTTDSSSPSSSESPAGSDGSGSASDSPEPGRLGSGSDLLVVDADAGTVTLVDGRSGRTVWTVQGDPPADPAVATQPAGDVDGDGAQDLLVTVASGSGGAAPEYHAVSGADGRPLWSASGRDGGERPAPLLQVAGAGVDPPGPGSGGHAAAWLWIVPALIVAAIVVAALLLRRRSDR